MDNNPPIQEPVFLIEVGKITVNPFQPRKYFDEQKLKELAGSIREYGVLQPLVVTKLEEETDSGTTVKYELIAGERRLRASKLAGLERVPAVIKNVGLDRERLEMAIVENVQRADLNPIESARAYSRLQDEFNLTQREIAGRIGKSREVIANTMRLLNLPTKVQDAISMGHLGESQARLLLSVDDIHQQDLLFEEVLNNSLSVRELKGKIDYIKSIERKLTPTGDQKKLGPLFDPEAESIKQRLEETLGTPVKVERKGDHGKITIEYFSVVDLQNLLQKISSQQSNQDYAPISKEDQVMPSEHSDDPEHPLPSYIHEAGNHERGDPPVYPKDDEPESQDSTPYQENDEKEDLVKAPFNLPVANLDEMEELKEEFSTQDDKPQEFTI